jgi:hypothetical protein
LTEWGGVDVQNDGASTGFYPDNGSSWSYCHANSAQNNLQGNGQGICNNRNDPSFVAYSPVVNTELIPNIAGTAGTPFFISSAVAGLPQAGAV